jgi:hypothetical protein
MVLSFAAIESFSASVAFSMQSHVYDGAKDDHGAFAPPSPHRASLVIRIRSNCAIH